MLCILVKRSEFKLKLKFVTKKELDIIYTYDGEYILNTEIVEEKDNYTMFKISKRKKTNVNPIYHLLLGNKLEIPFDIAINSQTHVIEGITFFVSDNSLTSFKNDIKIISRDDIILIDLEECSLNRMNLDLRNAKSKFVWSKYDNIIYFVQENHPYILYLYKIYDGCGLLIGEDNKIYGLELVCSK